MKICFILNNYCRESWIWEGKKNLFLFVGIFLGLNAAQAQTIQEGFEESQWTNLAAGGPGSITVNQAGTGSVNNGVWFYCYASLNTAAPFYHNGAHSIELYSTYQSLIMTPIITNGITTISFWVYGATTSSQIGIYVGSGTANYALSSSTKNICCSTGAITTNMWYSSTSFATANYSSDAWNQVVITVTGIPSNGYVKIQREGGTTYIDDININTCTAPAITGIDSGGIADYALNQPSSAFHVSAVGQQLYYQWYSNTDSSYVGGTLIPGATDSTYAPPTSTYGVFFYYCVIADSCSNTLATNLLGPINVEEVLPVQLLYFTAARTNNGNLLSWKMDCSPPATALYVERSDNGSDFSNIYSLVGDEVPCNQAFSYLDADAFSGVNNYYRIKIIGADNSVIYSKINVVWNDSSILQVLGVYPSVLTGNSYIEIVATKPSYIEVVLSDMYGQVISKSAQQIQAGDNQVKLDGYMLSKGVYNVSVYSSGVLQKNIKILKE